MRTSGWRRVVIEKPFGIDLASALNLNRQIHRTLHENQIYRIDHYLGKETVQNILVTRFANTIFEPLWNRNYIDHVQITVAEEVGVEHRGGYYDGVGVLRDMFQNHLLQLVSLVAMEPPSSFNADALRNEKVKVLSAVQPFEDEDMVEADGARPVQRISSRNRASSPIRPPPPLGRCASRSTTGAGRVSLSICAQENASRRSFRILPFEFKQPPRHALPRLWRAACRPTC